MEAGKRGTEQLFKPRSRYTTWPGQHLKTTVDHALELEGSPLLQAGNNLPNIWKLATQGIFVTEMPATEEHACFYKAGWNVISKGNHSRVPAKLLGQVRHRQVTSLRGATTGHRTDPACSQHHSPCLLSALHQVKRSLTWNTIAELEKQLYKPKLIPILGWGIHTGAALYQR